MVLENAQDMGIKLREVTGFDRGSALSYVGVEQFR